MQTQTRWALTTGVALALGSAQASGAQTVPVFVNGERLSTNAQMVNEVARTVVPMRALFESIGARVEWDPEQRAVYAWRPDGTGVRLPVGSARAQTLDMSAAPGPGNWGRVTGTYTLDVPSLIADGRVFVPLRFASEALKADVRYSAAAPAVYIQAERVAGMREEVTGEVPEMPQPVEPRQPGEEPQPNPTSPLTARQLGQAIEVETELRGDTYDLDRGRGIPLRVVVRNRSDRPLQIPMGGQQFDFRIYRNGQLVWNWAHEKAFIMILQQRTLEPEEEIVYTALWNMRNNEGQPVEPGRYVVRGMFVTAIENGHYVADEVITLTE